MAIFHFLKRRPLASAGIIIGFAVVIGLLLFYERALDALFDYHETMKVDLSQDYQIHPYDTDVKMSGAKVGEVWAVDEPDGPGPVEVTLKVKTGTRDLLGSLPTAVVRPKTILGGSYLIELYSGGTPGTFAADAIPADRARLPVELDKVLSAVTPSAQAGLRGMTERLDTTFHTSVPGDLKKLVKDAPDTLQPAGVVLDGLRGVNRDTDLARLTDTADSAARVLSQTPGQLSSVVGSLGTTSRALGDNSGPLARTISDLPSTLTATRNGARDLSTTLDKLTDTAEDAEPTAERLEPALKKLDPALADLRPVAHDLGPLLHRARPVLHELVPTVVQGNDVLDDVQGRPLDRVNNEILPFFNKKWKGTGVKWAGEGADGARFYEEFGYLFAALDGLTQYATNTSHLIGFGAAGGGSESLWGTGPQAEAFQSMLGEMWGLPHQGPNGGSRNGPLVPGTGQGFHVPAPDPGVAPNPLDPNGLLDGGAHK
jgi:phospholipid/cholesterol/gamma-HCH transport system substrate-binding protein